MTTYILILTLWGGSQAGRAVTTQEFSSQSSCVTAAALWMKNIQVNADKYHLGVAICVPK